MRSRSGVGKFVYNGRIVARREQLELPLVTEFASDAAILILVRDAETDHPAVLLARRIAGPSAGRYTFPGGKVEPGETGIKGVLRETLEEVGWGVDREDVIGATRRPVRIVADGVQRRVHNFFCFYDEAVGDQLPQRTEADKLLEWEWYSLPEVASLVSQGLLHSSIFSGWWLEEIAQAREVSNLELD